MKKHTPKEAASRRIDISLAIEHARTAIVELRMVQNAGENTPTRQNLANANAHLTAAIGTVQVYSGRAYREPR
jgi:hypothetical protein